MSRIIAASTSETAMVYPTLADVRSYSNMRLACNSIYSFFTPRACSAVRRQIIVSTLC